MSDSALASRPAGSKRAFTNSRGVAAGVAAGLHLAATPVFAIFAVLALYTALRSGQPDMLCAAMPHLSPFGGMVPMYLLMSIFHAAPWLKLLGGDSGRSRPLTAGKFRLAPRRSRC